MFPFGLFGIKKYPLDDNSRGYFCAQKQPGTPTKKDTPTKIYLGLFY